MHRPHGNWRIGWSMGTAALAIYLAAGLDGVSRRAAAAEPARDGDVKLSREQQLEGVDVTTVDRDAGGEVETPPARATAGEPIDPDCNFIGDVLFTFGPFANRYRGNVYRVEQAATVKEIKMELAFQSVPKLYVAIHQRAQDGSYRLYSPVIEILEPAGTNPATFQFYSTGLLTGTSQIALEPGFDYAIGFAWESANILFGRDAEIHPLPFEIGSILGSVGATLQAGVVPFVPEVFPSLSVFPGGAYSQQICLVEEPGACCSALDIDCHDVLAAQCTGAGSYFNGERTRCAETICDFGACCTRCGACLTDYTEGSCALADGADFWDGVTCPTDPSSLCSVVTGACCRTNGSCLEVCEATCAGLGVYHGDGTKCNPNPCKGACCVAGFGCSDRTEAGCDSFNGLFRGDGTSCATLAPEDECGGACCYGSAGLTTCQVIAPRSTCAYDAFPQTAYRGDGTTCSQPCGVIDNYRACCLPDGTCINTTEAGCNAVGVNGEYNASFRCEGLAAGCPNVSACCLPDGDCQVLTNRGCLVGGGVRPASNPLFCGPTTCAIGACCVADDEPCREITQAACFSAGGDYRGNGTSCVTPALVCPGLGACCRPNGDCFDNLTTSDCTQIGGDHQGDASLCDSEPVNCDTKGACCATTGFCLIATQLECDGIDGVFNGSGSACNAGACPTGACCVGNSCEILPAHGCTLQEGTYLGDDVACTPDPCNSGACCNAGVCAVQTEAACVAAEGLYVGDGEPCSAETCAFGACCSPDCTCVDNVKGPQCIAAGTTFVAGGTCAENVCTLGILASEPPGCSIDPAQPHAVESATPPLGITTLELTFICGAAGTTTGDFTIEVIPPGAALAIVQAVVSSNVVTLTFNRAIDPAAWTCVTHVDSGDRVCVGALPGDVNLDGNTLFARDKQGGIIGLPDMDALLNILAEVVPAPPAQCDLNRDGKCLPSDILTAADMFAGVDAFEVWVDRTLAACPNGPTP